MGAELATVERGAEPLAPAGATQQMILAAQSPAVFIERATEVATALAEVIRKQRLFKRIGQRDYVYVEAWTFLGSMMGAFGQSVYAVEDWTREYRDPETGEVIGWEARVEARTGDGQVVGAAESMCTRRESKWSDRDDFALRSMAQTRATSKALRMPLGFIVQLAGFAATPQEEMDEVQAQEEAKGLRLMADAPKGWKEISDRLTAIAPELEWKPWIEEACELTYGVTNWRDIPEENDRSAFGIRLANAIVHMEGLTQGREMPPIEEDEIRSSFAKAFDGHLLSGPPTVIEDDVTAEDVEEVEVEPAESDAALDPEQQAALAGAPPVEDVEFGEDAKEDE